LYRGSMPVYGADLLETPSFPSFPRALYNVLCSYCEDGAGLFRVATLPFVCMLFQVLTTPLPSWPRPVSHRRHLTSPRLHRRRVGAANIEAVHADRSCLSLLLLWWCCLFRIETALCVAAQKETGDICCCLVSWVPPRPPRLQCRVCIALAAPPRRRVGLVGSLRLRNGSSAGERPASGRGDDG
jgi:hypothetical protein